MAYFLVWEPSPRWTRRCERINHEYMGRDDLDTGRLRAAIVAPHDIDTAVRDQMYSLFTRHYRDVTRRMFETDMAAKDAVILLRHDDGIAGFTTAAFSTFVHAERNYAMVFSGDTIVDPAFWGEQELARAWLKQIGQFAARAGGRPLYWFLIVKGHRTYRYLPTFARAYVPGPGSTDDPDLVALRNAIAADRFGSAFDPATGIIRFADLRGRLDPAIAEPLPRELHNPHVRFFLAANPGFRKGDELACLCALDPGNMRPRALRWFADAAA